MKVQYTQEPSVPRFIKDSLPPDLNSFFSREAEEFV